MLEETIEIIRMTEADILLLQNTIPLSEIISVADKRTANFIGHSSFAEIFIFDEDRFDLMTICFRVGSSRCSIELACPKWIGVKSLCERNNFLNESSEAYSIVDRKLLSKIMTEDIVYRLEKKLRT